MLKLQVMKSLLAGSALCAALAVAGSSGAAAQGAAERYPWDGARRQYQGMPQSGQYGDDSQDDQSAAPDDDQNYDGRPGQERDYGNRQDDPGDDGYEERRYDNRNFGDRGFEMRPDDDEDEPDSGSDHSHNNRASPSDDDDTDARPIGVDGGQRPYIRPVAPPRIAFGGRYPIGSIVIDTGARKLYFVTGPTSAFAYSIGVGREGFAWTGTQKVSRIQNWPDWYPPDEMRKRRPELPKRMLGGLRNPLGAKAIYLGNTLYRIHGTNEPKSVGRAESSGCFRMTNENVLHLASLVKVGTPVTVVRSLNGRVLVSNANSSDREVPRQRPRRDFDRYTYDGYEPYDYDRDYSYRRYDRWR